MNKLPPSPNSCRDCGRKGIRWNSDAKDPKGPRCYDCQAKRRAKVVTLRAQA